MQYRITYFSFLLSLLVVILHCTSAISGYDDANLSFRSNDMIWNIFHFFFVLILRPFCRLAVPAFFILSGYLFFRNYKLNKTLSKYKSRFRSLVLPYLLWNAISVCWIMCLYSIPHLRVFIVSDTPFEITNMIDGLLFYKYNYFWFVGILIVYVCAAPIFYCLLKNRLGGIIIVLSFFLFCFFVLSDIKYKYYYDPYSLVTYSIGSYLGIHFKNLTLIKLDWQSSKYSIAILLCLLFINAIIQLCEVESFFYELYKCTFYVIAPLLLWPCLNMFYNGHKIKWYHHLSFFVYAIHIYIQKPLCGTVHTLFSRYMETVSFSEFIQYLIVIPVSIALCIAVAKFTNKYYPQTFRVLCGGRNYS